MRHGGAAKQVKQAAALRLAALVDPSIGVVAATLKQKKRPDLALKAAMDVLDRQGFKAESSIKSDGAGGFQITISSVLDKES